MNEQNQRDSIMSMARGAFEERVDYEMDKVILSPSWGENLTGAFRVDVVKPTYKALDDTQVAKFSGHLTVSHKVESEVV